MAGLALVVALGIVGVFVMGVAVGLVLVVTVAARREQARGPWLKDRAADPVTAAGRWLTRLSVRKPTKPGEHGDKHRRNGDLVGR